MDLALAGDRDKFVATPMDAIWTVFRHRSGDFIGVDPAVGRGLRKIPLLAIGACRGGAAAVALGEALVDPVAVGLVGDDENVGFGARGPCRDEEDDGESRCKESHETPGNG